MWSGLLRTNEGRVSESGKKKTFDRLGCNHLQEPGKARTIPFFHWRRMKTAYLRWRLSRSFSSLNFKTSKGRIGLISHHHDRHHHQGHCTTAGSFLHQKGIVPDAWNTSSNFCQTESLPRPSECGLAAWTDFWSNRNINHRRSTTDRQTLSSISSFPPPETQASEECHLPAKQFLLTPGRSPPH